MIPKGTIVQYVDVDNNIHQAILQEDVDDPGAHPVSMSTWSLPTLGIIVLDPHLNVSHSSVAGGAPYWFVE